MNKHLFIENLFQPLLTAGDYTRRIQNKIKHSLKPNESEYCNMVVTDADLAVQNFLEVHFLSHINAISLYGEEDSANSKYFCNNCDWEISIDPINGTLPYKDGQDNYDIIVTLSDRESIRASILYMPQHEIFFFSIKGEGAFKCSKTQWKNGEIWNRFKINDDSINDHILIHGDASSKNLLSKYYKITDYVYDYRKDEYMLLQNAILTGELTSFIRFGAMIFDWSCCTHRNRSWWCSNLY